MRYPKSISNIEEKRPPAGQFSAWLRRFRKALKNETGINVKCGDCNACCRSSQFIHVKPGETETIARIDKRLLFPAPGLPRGNMVLGYDKDGCCPMLIKGQCSIYEDRPITCRNYDCRIFAAAGINAGGKEKELVNQQVRRWRFKYKDALDRRQHSAVMAAAEFLKENARIFPAGSLSGNPSQLAILAIKCYDVFLRPDLLRNKKETVQKMISKVQQI
ncbi:MAG: YkgJ family cysteine cluster protein [Candidatus Edwardsbacteria bacterium]|nr:YkgJ family cysteine cluster protein [Candidatus Edwardsbacteria bacterium]